MNLRARLLRAFMRALARLTLLRRKLMSPRLALMELTVGIWPALALRALVKTGVIDRLHVSSCAPSELAHDLQLDAGSVRRVLRLLTGYGVVHEDARGNFTLTKIGRLAARRSAATAAPFIEYIGESWQLQPWAQLEETLRTGEPAFARLYGTTFFEFLRENRDAAALFDSAMSSVSALHAQAIVQAYDFRKAALIADIGGGKGLLLAQILASAPPARGLLFDLAHAYQGAQTLLAPVRNRVDVVSGDFFEEIPAEADIYVLSHILHDWSDDRALQILRNVQRAMRADSKALIIEAILEPGSNVLDAAKLTDVQMLAFLGGRERTREEFASLLGAAGLRVRRIIPTSAAEFIIEAEQAGGR